MPVETPAQVIEVFHLLFLRVLASDRQDWFVLKGGANIRYFFESHRYSNDIDLDFHGREAWKVGETVEKVLGGRALGILTRQAKIEIAETSAPKQTNTTRRWKIGLVAEGHTGTIRTKVEFSDRNGWGDDVAFEAVPDAVVRPYGVTAPLVVHYRETAAIDQKIAALALRSETKARDVYDLDLLIRRRHAAPPPRPDLSPEHASEAALRALEIPFDSFRSEVVPFLDPDVAALYDEATWDQMRTGVATSLDELVSTTGGDQ
ncbi:MAG TPA: nucleotidyl transferase AbiEii/AbiGii toxin family protein [Acidimicrobiales bacterium]|jgi:predicted nucleotidyltransferase component of viral defense system|nr:nucleotidyl transferase AbiEii/AbiGii toxin family protein [Acidimicrobiales bacterium]